MGKEEDIEKRLAKIAPCTSQGLFIWKSEIDLKGKLSGKELCAKLEKFGDEFDYLKCSALLGMARVKIKGKVVWLTAKGHYKISQAKDEKQAKKVKKYFEAMLNG